ncbi:MAG TPA: hypothetical protein VNI77_06775 [Nitrososphaera sp.]|nr:hypothetical protein [Nitrososphaera sp.]
MSQLPHTYVYLVQVAPAYMPVPVVAHQFSPGTVGYLDTCTPVKCDYGVAVASSFVYLDAQTVDAVSAQKGRVL